MKGTETKTVFCPECGTQNDDYLERCISCDHLLDPTAAAAQATAGPRPFHLRTFAIAAGTSAAFVLLFQLLGLSFSMEVLPADGSPAQIEERLDDLVYGDRILSAEAHHIERDLARNAALRLELARNELPSEEAQRLREGLRPIDQSVVVGIGGVLGFVPPLFGFILAGAIAAAVVRTRRLREVALGAAVGLLIQLVAWFIVADLALGAVFGGDLWMTGTGLGFNGTPIMLTGMALVIFGAAATGAAFLAGIFAEQVTGVAACRQCEHRFSVRPRPPAACPKCAHPLPKTNKLRYRDDDAFLDELGGTAQGITRASSGASELLCLRCAKTYAADQCPTHPREPLLDPSRDDVRFRLMELDAEAGTSRYARWTAELKVAAASPASATPTGPRLCMECAKTYEGDHCPVHRDEPLLDPTQEDVRLELIDADDRARSRMSTRLMLASGAVAVVASAAVAILLDDAASLSASAFAGTLVALITLSQVLAPKLAPPRFSRWTGEGHVDADEFGMGAKATIYGPLRRAGKHLALGLIITAVGAGAAAGIGALTGLPVVGAALLGGLVAMLGFIIVVNVIDRTRGVANAVAEAKKAWDDPYA